MNQAKIEQVGTPEEVFHHPASEFVMDFLGQVNLFTDVSRRANPGSPSASATSPAVQPVKIFARPFDLEIHRDSLHESALPAKVRRVLAAGSRVKVELSGSRGRERPR